MSVCWWNPKELAIIADSYQPTHSSFISRAIRVGRTDNLLIGSVGDARFRHRFLTFLGANAVIASDGTEMNCESTQAIVYEFASESLFYLTVENKVISLYGIDPQAYYAIGDGADAVMVLSDLGLPDDSICDALVNRIAHVQRPFHRVCNVQPVLSSD